MPDAAPVAQQTNGTPQPADPGLLKTPGPIARAQSRIRAGRADTLAALEAGAESAPTMAEPKPVEKAASSDVEVEPETTEAHVDEPDTEAKPEEKVEAAPTDPESTKRLASIQAAEKRSREKVAKERESLAAEKAALAKERAELEAMRSEAESLKKARERAKIDPVGYLEAAGVDDLEYAARMAFAKHKGATDPAQREAHARELQRREQQDDVGALKREMADLRAELARERQQAQFDSHQTAYLDHAVKAIGDSAPIAKALAAKNPAKLRAALWTTTERLIAENEGDVPDFGEVIETYESQRRAELDELGVSLPAAGKAATTETKQNNQTADKKHPAKTLGNDLSTPRVPRPVSKKSDREHRAETLAMLEREQLE